MLTHKQLSPLQQATASLLKSKNGVIADSDLKNTIIALQLLHKNYLHVLHQEGIEYDQVHNDTTFLIDTFDEAHGNFNRIFPEDSIDFNFFVEILLQGGNTVIKTVDPLMYFTTVGNGMNVDTTKSQIQTLPQQFHSAHTSQDKAKVLIDYIKQGNHIGVSQKQYEEDLAHAKNHDTTMIWMLEQISKGYILTPAFVAIFAKCTKVYGENIDKVILDGTHRAFVCAITKSPLFVIEVDMDAIVKP